MISYTFDRDEVLALLRKRVGGFLAGYRKNLALLGPEGAGKTLLLRRLLQEGLPAVPPPVPVYVEVRDGENVVEWTARFAQSVFYPFLQSRGVSPLPRNLPELLRICGDYAPKSAAFAARVLRLAEQGRSDEAYEQMWDLPQGIAQETGCQSVLVIDEFHRLRGLPVKDPFRPLGRRVMVQSSSLFVVASSHPAAARAILKEGLALLFGQFEVLEIGPLSPLACLRAVRAVWPGVREDPFLEEIFLELAQGHAATLDLLLSGLREQLGRPGERSPQQVLLDLLQALFVGPESEMRSRFEARLRSLPAHHTRPFCIQVLCAAAGGKHRLAQIAEQLDRSSAQVSRALQILEQSGLVERHGAFQRVPGRLFELWMRMGYPVLQGVGLAGPGEASAHFQEMSSGWITQIRQAVQRPAAERVADLLREWKGEVVEVEGHRTLLPAFGRIELVAGPAGRPVIRARRSGRQAAGWCVLPWSGPLSEGEARELAELARVAGKDFRAAVVGAYPIDINARLILQQAKVRLWDLQTLNTLLDLYGQPLVPVPRDFDVGMAEEVRLPQERPAARAPDSSRVTG